MTSYELAIGASTSPTGFDVMLWRTEKINCPDMQYNSLLGYIINNCGLLTH